MDFSTVGGSGSFHCFHQLQLPRIYSMEASMRFHIPLQTSTYFTEYHKLPAACTRLTGPYCCPPPLLPCNALRGILWCVARTAPLCLCHLPMNRSTAPRTTLVALALHLCSSGPRHDYAAKTEGGGFVGPSVARNAIVKSQSSTRHWWQFFGGRPGVRFPPQDIVANTSFLGNSLSISRATAFA